MHASRCFLSFVFTVVLFAGCSSRHSISVNGPLRTDTVLVRLPAIEIMDKALQAVLSEAVDSISTCSMLSAYPSPYLIMEIGDIRQDTLDMELYVRVDKWFVDTSEIRLLGVRGGTYHSGVPVFIASRSGLWDLSAANSRLRQYLRASGGEVLLPLYQQLQGNAELWPPLNAQIHFVYRRTSEKLLRLSYTPCGSGPPDMIIKRNP